MAKVAEQPQTRGGEPADVVLAVLASAQPMGQQVYEERLYRGLSNQSALRIERVRVRSMRSRLPGEARVPMGSWPLLPSLARHAMARHVYGPARLVHRCDLRLPPSTIQEVLTVHDAAWLSYPDEGVPPRGFDMAVRSAAGLIAPSRFTADELMNKMGVDGARVSVVPNGIDDRFRNARPLSADECRALGLPLNFILHNGGSSQRKNLRSLAGAWTELLSRHPDVGLVLCGPVDERRTALFEHLPRTFLAGRVSDAQLPRLVASARCVVVPSLYEGFGLPVVEAMAAGTVVVAASTGSLPEVAGGCAILTRPDIAGLAAGIEQALRVTADSPLIAKGHARARTFTWARSVQLHQEIYSNILGRAR